MERTSRGVGVLRRVAVVTVVSPTGVPVVVGAAVIPRTTRVVPLSLEGPPVALKNLGAETNVRM